MTSRGVQQRDLLLRRYWRRDDDGTYGVYICLLHYHNIVLSLFPVLIAHDFSGLCFTVILYHSVYHKKCLPQKGYIRACLKSNVLLNHAFQSVFFLSNVLCTFYIPFAGRMCVPAPIGTLYQGILSFLHPVYLKIYWSIVYHENGHKVKLMLALEWNHGRLDILICFCCHFMM